MRISEIMTSPSSRLSSPPVPASKPRTSSLPEKRTPTLPLEASFSPNPSIELKLRQEMEQELKRQVERLRLEYESFYQEREEAERKTLVRERDLYKLKEQNLNQQRDGDRLDQQKEWENYRKKIEEEWTRRLEVEKQILSEGMNQELNQLKRQLQEYQQRLSQKEAEIIQIRKSMNEAATTQAVSYLQPTEVKEVQPPIKPLVVVTSAVKPEIPVTHVELPAKPKESPSVQETLPTKFAFEPDPKVEVTARKLRDEMIFYTHQVFEEATRAKTLNLEGLKANISSLVQFAALHDWDLMKMGLEPYPDEHHFTSHGVNVALLSLVLAQEFSFPIQDLEQLTLAAVLHDIGLVSVKEDLSYSEKMTPQTEKNVLNHTVRGVEMLKEFLGETGLTTVLQHHEVGNGKGYPSGLQDADIHIFAKILHVADSFEALVHERPYRQKPLEVHEAMKQLIDLGRGIYDRNVLKALMVRVGLYPVMTYVELSNRQVGRVMYQNRQYPLSPTVQVEYDENRSKLAKPYMIDLSQTQFVHILGALRKQAGTGEQHTQSHFAQTKAPVKLDPKVIKAAEIKEIIQRVVSLGLVLAVLAVLLYVVVKI